MSGIVRLELANFPIQETLTVADGESVLVGREPSAERVASLLPGPNDFRLVPIGAPSVSANHLAIRREGQSITLVDTDSRNGTWLELPRGHPVRIDAERPINLTLALVRPPLGQTSPAEASWVDSTDFHLGIATAVGRWFEQQRIEVSVTTPRSTTGTASNRRVGQIPLGNGHDLQVEPLRTVTGQWEESLGVLWRYVNSQNALLGAEEEARSQGIVLASPAIRKAHRRVVEAAQRGLRLLLVGETGSGKYELAECYHRHTRRDGKIVRKDCTMLSAEFLRVELFGAEQGAYTSSVRRATGAVEKADGGTLFLDEIGELPTELQARLLTFLDRGEFERLGSSGEVRTADVRLVCATNRDLRDAARKGQFREDLWYRLAGEVVEVPPLRERQEDIDAYLKSRQLESGCDVYTALEPEALAGLKAHPWRGNFRELENFTNKLPREAKPASISRGTCFEILETISLTEIGTATAPIDDAPAGEFDLSELAGRADAHFQNERGHGINRWEDVTDCLERYLKPLVLAKLTGADGLSRSDDADLQRLSKTLAADRMTISKQLKRYFEVFRQP